MPPQIPAPTQVPTGQVNPQLMAIIRARAMQGAQGTPVGPAPNSMPTPGAPAMPTAAPPNINIPQRPGGASPTQQVMKSAAQAQSPLMDQQTRQVAKTLIQKLMMHM